QERPKTTKPKGPQKVLVELSMVSVAKAALIILAFYFLLQFVNEIGKVIVIVFVAILFSAAIDHTVNYLERKKIPRPISVLGIYLVLLFIVGFFISNLIPIVAEQLLELAKQADNMVKDFMEGKGLEDIPFSDKITPYLQNALHGIDEQTVISQLEGALEKVANQLQGIAGNTWGAIKVVFSSVFNAVIVFVLTFFLVADKGSIDRFIMALLPSRHSKYVVEKSEAIKDKVGHWLRGMITLMFLMFVLYLIGFSILGIKYATTLAIMGGIAELFPVIGPIMAGIPVALIAFNQSPWLILWVIGLIIFVQQIEGNVLIPLVMRKATGLSPIIVIISVLIGYELLGILGIVLATPVAATISIFIADYMSKDK
ncbi:MAG: hypothetical protein ACD_65C00016G0001, partial [uncultured bacterium]